MNAYKMHEVRMWTVQVILPLTIFAIYMVETHPEIKQKVKNVFTRKNKKTTNK